jgi:hypothetical protein
MLSVACLTLFLPIPGGWFVSPSLWWSPKSIGRSPSERLPRSHRRSGGGEGS